MKFNNKKEGACHCKNTSLSSTTKLEISIEKSCKSVFEFQLPPPPPPDWDNISLVTSGQHMSKFPDIFSYDIYGLGNHLKLLDAVTLCKIQKT